MKSEPKDDPGARLIWYVQRRPVIKGVATVGAFAVAVLVVCYVVWADFDLRAIANALVICMFIAILLWRILIDSSRKAVQEKPFFVTESQLEYYGRRMDILESIAEELRAPSSITTSKFSISKNWLILYQTSACFIQLANIVSVVTDLSGEEYIIGSNGLKDTDKAGVINYIHLYDKTVIVKRDVSINSTDLASLQKQ